MKEVAWIFGTSASGKETFMRDAPQNSALLKQLGWSGLKVAVCGASVSYIGQFHNDPITEHRDKILHEVPELLENSDIVLVKWQFVDSEADRLRKLRDKTAGVNHRIIELYAPTSELVERVQQKSWWQSDWVASELVANEQELVQGEIQELKAEFSVVTIKSGEMDNYEVSAR